MAVQLNKKQLGLALMMLGALPLPSYCIERRFEIEPGMLGEKYAISPSPAQAKAPRGDAVTSTYMVKRGDYLYKILAREYGIRGGRAEAVVQKVKILNHLADVRKLRVGQTLLIPAVTSERAGNKSRRGVKTAAAEIRRGEQAAPAANPEQPAAAQQRSSSTVIREACLIWPQLVSYSPAGRSRLDYVTGAFSLSLDPGKYPVVAAQDGGMILIDGNRSLPALVKSLLQAENPQLGVVSEAPENRRGFFRSLLRAARFYSFEEDFLVEFGTDSKITVHADFKIEKVPDSLMHQEIILLKVAENRRPTPQGVVKLLAANGFNLVETSTSSIAAEPAMTGSYLYQIPGKDTKTIAEALLHALGVPFETGKRIDLYAGEDNGVHLEVRVQQYFERSGNRFVLALFGADPVGEALADLLEARGYRVVLLQEGDDLEDVSDKLLSRMDMAARYGEQELWSAWEEGYGVRIPGLMIRDANNGGNIFITDRNLDPLVLELAELRGYSAGR